MTENYSRPTILEFIRHEPLIHFLGIAAMLFVANALFSGDSRDPVIVDWPTQEYLIQQQEDLLLRSLGEEEKRQIVEGFIEEEILVREARKRGFDSSSRIRALLIQNMRFFLTSDLPAPTETELREFYDDHPETFTTTASISYDHVLFRDPDTAPANTLERLRNGVDFREMGDDDGMVGRRLSQISPRSIAASFGPETAPQVLAIEDRDWHGPFLSPQGAHFLRISERHAARNPPFDTIENWISGEWTLAKSRERIDAELERLSDEYRIEILEPAGDAE